MIYSWFKITYPIKVNNLIKSAQKDIRTYTVRINSAEVQNENSSDSPDEHAQEIAETQADLDSTIAQLAVAVAGSPSHKTLVGKQKKLDSKLYDLHMDDEAVGEEALLLKEYRMGKNKALLAEAVKFEAEGQVQKTALGG